MNAVSLALADFKGRLRGWGKRLLAMEDVATEDEGGDRIEG